MSLDDKIPASFGTADSPFIPGTNIQFAWDSVSLSAMLTCPQQYKYRIIDGLVPKTPSYAIALIFGILFHKGLEYYHQARMVGDHDEALHQAVKCLLANPATATLPSDDDIDEMKEKTDEDDDGITLRNSKIRTRYHLFRSVVWYLEHYKDDPLKTLVGNSPMVELSFRIPLPIGIADVGMILCGHIDRVVEFNGFNYVTDYKTTKSLTRQYFDMFDLSHQMTGYSTAGKIILDQPVKGIFIDGVALQVGQVKFARHLTHRTAGQEREYFDLLDYVGQQAIRHARTGNYPLNTAGCYFCEFKNICKQAPEYRQAYIRQNYHSLPGWNPLENR